MYDHSTDFHPNRYAQEQTTRATDLSHICAHLFHHKISKTGLHPQLYTDANANAFTQYITSFKWAVFWTAIKRTLQHASHFLTHFCAVQYTFMTMRDSQCNERSYFISSHSVFVPSSVNFAQDQLHHHFHMRKVMMQVNMHRRTL